MLYVSYFLLNLRSKNEGVVDGCGTIPHFSTLDKENEKQAVLLSN